MSGAFGSQGTETERAVRLHGGSANARNRPGGGLVEIRLPALPAAANEDVVEATGVPSTHT